MPVELKDLFVVTVYPDTESTRYLEMREYSDPIEDIISLSICVSIAVIAFDDQQPPFRIRAHSGPFVASQSEEVVFLKQSHCSIVRVVRDHNAERHVEVSLLVVGNVRQCSFLDGENILGVVLQIAVIRFKS